jgi:hypothetical protein
MIKLGILMLEELNAKEREEREEATYKEARAAALAKASTFLKSLSINTNAFKGLPNYF